MQEIYENAKKLMEGYCRAKGIIGCAGDGVPDFIHETGLSVIRQA